jgi:NAD(P)-dependent dehydrogenase (short-subunit alcohol dehydrogenase family)
MTDWDFAGSVAAVIGGAGGIGRALGARFAEEGCRLALLDRQAGPVQAVAQGIPRAIGVVADVGDRASLGGAVEEVEARLGPIDGYCSNAGVPAGSALGEDEDWDLSWRVHAMAHVQAARLVLPGMVERGHGAMVITASAAGLLLMMQSAPYTVTKHAAVAIAEWLAVNFGASGVQLHCVCPQAVRTPMLLADVTGNAGAEVAASGSIIEPSVLADEVVAAIRVNRFLVLPHPEVHEFEQRQVTDRDRWLAGMRRLLSRIVG